MSFDYKVDPDNIEQLKEILEKEMLIRERLNELEEHVERFSAFLDDDVRLVMIPKSDLLELLTCAVYVYKLKKNEEEFEKYIALYVEYTTTSIYEEKAEETLLSLMGADKLELVVRKNLRDAYLAQDDKDNADFQATLIAELSERMEGTGNG